MSLVTARLSRLGVRLYSDSQVTDPSQSKNNVIPGRLKLVVVNPNVCIGFAGQPYIAINAIRKVGTLSSSWSIIEHLIECHQGSKEAADFIVATLQPRSLHQISAGQHLAGGQEYWIGDYEVSRSLRSVSMNFQRLRPTMKIWLWQVRCTRHSTA